jgi:hypothetical protein
MIPKGQVLILLRYPSVGSSVSIITSVGSQGGHMFSRLTDDVANRDFLRNESRLMKPLGDALLRFDHFIGYRTNCEGRAFCSDG